MTNLTSSVLNVLEFFKNFFLGVIISIYVIIAKDALLARGKRLVYYGSITRFVQWSNCAEKREDGIYQEHRYGNGGGCTAGD